MVKQGTFKPLDLTLANPEEDKGIPRYPTARTLLISEKREVQDIAEPWEDCEWDGFSDQEGPHGHDHGGDEHGWHQLCKEGLIGASLLHPHGVQLKEEEDWAGREEYLQETEVLKKFIVLMIYDLFLKLKSMKLVV